MNSSYTSPTTKPLYRATQVVWYILSLIEILLAARFLLKLFGANTAASFTSFIYQVTYPLANPFLAVFQSTQTTQGGVFEWTTLLAMLVYWIIAVAIVNLFMMGRTVSTPEAAARLESQEDDL